MGIAGKTVVVVCLAGSHTSLLVRNLAKTSDVIVVQTANTADLTVENLSAALGRLGELQGLLSARNDVQLELPAADIKSLVDAAKPVKLRDALSAGQKTRRNPGQPFALKHIKKMPTSHKHFLGRPGMR